MPKIPLRTLPPEGRTVHYQTRDTHAFTDKVVEEHTISMQSRPGTILLGRRRLSHIIDVNGKQIGPKKLVDMNEWDNPTTGSKYTPRVHTFHALVRLQHHPAGKSVL